MVMETLSLNKSKGLISIDTGFLQNPMSDYLSLFMGTLRDGLVSWSINAALTVNRVPFKLGTWSHVFLFKG
jgi:hypothetical protein